MKRGQRTFEFENKSYLLDIEDELLASGLLGEITDIEVVNATAKTAKETDPWTKITKKQFKEDLEALIKNPSIIDQGITPWCGAGAAIYLAITLDPEGFRKNTWDLFNQGYVAGSFWNNTYDLDASDDLYDEKVPNKSQINNAAIFIAMSTFKNEYKEFDPYIINDLDPGDYQNNAIGITLPMEVVHYLTHYYDISYEEGDGAYDPGLIDLLYWKPIEGIQELIKSGHTVLLIVNASLLNKSDYSALTQHYIVVDNVEKENEFIIIRYFDPNGIIRDKKFKVEEWKKIINWYGGFK